jgi:uncharacterized membrane protein
MTRETKHWRLPRAVHSGPMERLAVEVRRRATEALRGERWPFVVVALALASSLCVGLVAGRIALSGQPGYAFLVWNLALAWVPLWLALGVWLGYQAAWPRWIIAALAGLWLLFLPNAPYIVTDYVHLWFGYDGAPLWFDALAISAYAATGLLLGFASLYLVQAVCHCTLGERLTWLLVYATLGLSSIGIYLGRYQRMNSWDAIRDPMRIPSMIRVRLADPLGNEALLFMVISFTVLLTALYLVFYNVVIPRFEEKHDARFARR